MGKMLALRAREGARTAHLEEIGRPRIGPHDVLMKVVSAGLAPGMFNLLERGLLKQLPTTLGHEAAGVAEAVGEAVDDIRPGDRVRMHPTMTCGRCRYCLSNREQMCAGAAMIGFAGFGARPVRAYNDYHEGALAEYVCVPAAYVDVLPDNVGFDVGAKVHDLANAVRCLSSAGLAPGATVIVLAATGTMGTATIKLARYFGIVRLVLIGRSAARLEELRGLTDIPVDTVGLDALAPGWAENGGLAERVKALLPDGADAILDYAPNGSEMWQALEGLAVGGSFVHMGGNLAPFPVPLTDMLKKCWRVVATRNHSRSDVRLVLDLLEGGTVKVDDLITHRFSLAEVERAVQVLRSRSEPVWMAVINP